MRALPPHSQIPGVFSSRCPLVMRMNTEVIEKMPTSLGVSRRDRIITATN
jgi:hypothetical protein